MRTTYAAAIDILLDTKVGDFQYRTVKGISIQINILEEINKSLPPSRGFLNHTRFVENLEYSVKSIAFGNRDGKEFFKLTETPQGYCC